MAKDKEYIAPKARITFSRWCRSGIIGNRCRCWRCRGYDGPAEGADKQAKRDAWLIDSGREWLAIVMAKRQPASNEKYRNLVKLVKAEIVARDAYTMETRGGTALLRRARAMRDAAISVREAVKGEK